MANLLERSSLVLTPTAYNNGEALCIKPDDASGDFQFSRNSAATRVNAQGLVENVQILSSNLVQNGDFSEEGVQEVSNGSFSQEGSELITNGDFSSDTAWAKQSGWIITNGYATQDGSGSFQKISQIIDTENGKIYKIKVSHVLNGVSLSIRARDTQPSGTVLSNLDVSTDGISELTFTAISNKTAIVFQNGNANIIQEIDNVSVREVGQDWTLGTGISIGDDEAIFTSVASGQQLAQLSLLGVSGKTYKVSYEIKSRTEGAFSASIGTTISANQNSGVGVYTEYLTATGTGAFYIRSRGTTSGSITNISVKEVGMDWDLQTGWSIADGKAVVTNAPALYQRLSQASLSFTLNSTYEISITCSEYSSGFIYLRKPRGTEPDTSLRIDNVGTFVFTLKALTELNEFALAIGSVGTDLSITNISVIEITDDTNLPRINYEGFSYQDALGSELVTNGDFATDSNWNKNSNWSIGGNVANCDGTSNGDINQGTTLATIGKSYKISYEVVSISQGEFFFKFGGVNGTLRNSIGVYTETIQAINTNRIALDSSNNATGSIDNVSVKEYLGQEVVPDSGCGSWLWEPQTTQLLPYSEDFSNASWGKGTDVSIEGGYLAPDGNNTAYKVTKTGISTPYLTRNQSLVATTTRSIYAKTVSGTGTATLLSHNSNTNNTFTLTEQWQRFELSDTASSSGQSTFYAADFRGSGTLTEYLVWGANATNDQDYATSYIPSNGSQTTRNQDVCSNGGSLATINSTEGVLYAEIAALSDDLTLRSISLSDGSTNNVVTIRYRTNSNRIQAVVFSGGVLQFSNSFDVTNILDFNKVAVSYNQSNFNYWVNGVKRANSTSGNTPIGLNELSFDNGNSGLKYFGKTKALAVWKEALSDSELQSLTTI